MSDDVFDGHVLAEKLFKLNSSQQSIESLSRLCISHRKKAKQIVETWDKSFKSAQREQRVSFLYLANDILQNSRRKGNEFVNEFWKVLPTALKHVYENTDEQGKKAASRLVDIWDERRVFGSRGQNLKDEMLGKNSLAQVSNVSNGKSSNPIKIVKRDAHSLRIKLAVGGMPEKILTAFQLVHDEHVNEETALNNCEGAVRRIGDMERDVESNSTQGNLQGSAVLDEIQEQENVLQQCVSQLEYVEATRTSLVSQLKEALHDQELKLELIHSQLQVARRQVEQAASIRQKLASPSLAAGHATPLNQPVEVMRVADHSQVQQTSLPPPVQTLMSFVTTKATDEENKKAAAAAVAAKLAASTSSAQMLTSVLSSLVAEEAASISGGFKSAGFSTGLSVFSPDKRQKLEKPMSVSDASNSEAGNSAAYFASLQQQSVTNVPLAPPTSMQPMSQSNQTPFTPPPPPPGIPGNTSTNQFVQSSGMMMGVMPYVFGGSSLPPPPPLPSHIAIGGLARPAPQPPQQPQSQQPQQQQQQQTMNGGYYRPPGIGFYGQTHHPAPPPVPRQ